MADLYLGPDEMNELCVPVYAIFYHCAIMQDHPIDGFYNQCVRKTSTTCRHPPLVLLSASPEPLLE